MKIQSRKVLKRNLKLTQEHVHPWNN
jgi:hypothetical protein